MLRHVKHLVEAGFAIHRLRPKSKAPLADNWPEAPVATWEDLRRTYREGENLGVRLGKWSRVDGYYLYVADLDIRDADKAEEALAKLIELFPTWEDMPVVLSGSGGDSRHYYFYSDKEFTSSKLAHSETKFVGRDGKKHWSWEIEFFGTGKQVAMPPSIHPDTGLPYRWLKQFDFTEVALGVGPFVDSNDIEHMLNIPGTLTPEEMDRQKPLGLSIEEVEDLLSYIDNDDVDYDDWLNVMASIQHEAMGRNKKDREALFQIFRKWSAKSDKHDDATAKYKFFSFRNRDTRRNRTMRSIQAEVQQIRLDAEIENLDDTDPLDEDDGPSGESTDFDDILGASEPPEPVSKRQQKLNKAKVEAELGHVPPKVARINKKHAVAFINGKTTIITESVDGTVSYGTVGDLHNFYENDRVATEKATEPVTKAWLRHKKRREYPNGVVFAPGEEIEGAYNHWRGFSVEPEPRRSCRLILQHIRKIVCRDEATSYDYLIGWLAHMIQMPGEKPGVAVVLRGEKGVGKDTIGDYVGGLFKHHHVKIANQEHMIGRFNAHQEKCLMLHVEEGFWAGNKQADGSLKHLITSEKVFIEPKGLNGFHVKSVLRLFMSSNEKWVVPATEGERRYFVLDVDNRYSLKQATHEQRKRYFDAIRQEMLNGGRGALLHFLQTYDLSKFDVRAAPDTAALAEQKVQGLRNIERWWHGQLQSGETEFPFTKDKGGSKANWVVDPIAVDRGDLRDSYSRWLRSRRFDGEELRDWEIGKRLQNLVPSLRSSRKNVGGDRPRVYVLPTLPECRETFEQWLGSAIEWPEVESSSSETEYDDLGDDL